MFFKDKPNECPWYKHTWSKWGDLEEAKSANDAPVMIQKRRCEKCNMHQIHMLVASERV